MDPRDDDIDFDFFEDEAATTEQASPSSRVRLPRRGGRGTGMRRPAGPPRGLTPLLRLLGLIVVLVVVLVFFGLVIQSCAATSKHDRYQHYMAQVSTIAHSSEADGAAVADALTTPGTKVAEPDREALRDRRAGAAERRRRAEPEPARPAPRREPRDRPGAAVARQRRRGARDGVRDHGDVEVVGRRGGCSPPRPSGCSRATWSGTTSSGSRPRP